MTHLRRDSLPTVGMKALAERTRRYFLRDCTLGLGAVALASLFESEGRAAEVRDPFSPKPPFFPAQIKNVILIHLSGGPPHLDLFDYKPELVRRNGQDCPASLLAGKSFAFTAGVPKLLGTPRKFKQQGQSGLWFSDALPHLSRIADDLTFVKSLATDQFNHGPAELLMYTGAPRQGRPSVGSWVSYGLGSECRDLPGFIVFLSGGSLPFAGKDAWSSGFLPSVYQGVQCRTGGDPVLFLSDPEGMDRPLRRLSLDVLKNLNEMQANELGNPETATRIAQYEMAYRMQSVAPDVMNLSQEPPSVLEKYGAVAGAPSLANNCLMARRLVERGVRFIQLVDFGWDFHGTKSSEDVREGLDLRCKDMDRPVAALITDLKNRGLLDETLVVWMGEFGRTPFREGRTATGAHLGRDHHPHANTVMLAGGGLRHGFSHGATDELGFQVVEGAVDMHDLHATMLNLLGMDHTKLTYRLQGRDFRLTDVHGRIIREILA